ncbi:MAG: 4-alpha-glucanotransferase [Verrucomicrobiales bacterium]
MNRRLAGILVPFFSIRGSNDLGIGDVSALREFVGFAAETGFGFVQLLPVNEMGPDNSPYNAISSVAIEPTTLDCTPEGLADLTDEAFEKTVSGYDLESMNAGPIRYGPVRQLKHELLHRAFDRYMDEVDGRVDVRAESFDSFCREEAEWLNDYCVFRLFMDREEGSEVWHDWSEEYRTKERALEHIAKLAREKPAEIDRELRYYAYVQWIAFNQWREVSDYAASKDVCLMGDIPFGISLYSVDVWANADIFDLDWFGGAPPEKLFKDDEFVQKWGQNWGIPLYRWDVLEERGYEWWVQRIRKTTEIFGMFRIDHALGFYRIYAFPWNPVKNDEFLPLDHDEAAARCGGRLPGFRPRADHSEESRNANRRDGEKYLRMVQEAAGEAEVIAEDLGTVPEYVQPSLSELGIPGMKVPQWEFTDGHVTSGLHYPAVSFAAYATHDHFPMRAQWEQNLKQKEEAEDDSPEWWEARNFLATLCAFAGIEAAGDEFPDYTPEVFEALLRELCLSNSDRVAFLITDLLFETDRINIPGVMEGSNWSYRLPASAKELAVGKEYGDLRGMLKKVLKETGRSRRVGGF